MKTNRKQSKWMTGCTLGLLATSSLTLPAHADGDQEALGTLIGGIIGAATGNAIGDGDPIAIILGAGAGAAIGNSVGSALDEKDKLEAENAYLRSMNGGVNQTYEWQGRSNGGHRGRFQTQSEFRNNEGYNCRTYVSESWINGQYIRREGTSCLYPDGTWREWVRETSRPTPPPPRTYQTFSCVLYDDFGNPHPGYSEFLERARRQAYQHCIDRRNPMFCQNAPSCTSETRYESPRYEPPRYEPPRYEPPRPQPPYYGGPYGGPRYGGPRPGYGYGGHR
jgi:surface antigen